MLKSLLVPTLAAVPAIGDTIEMIVESLGVFAIIFAFSILVILCFLLRAWFLLMSNASPVDLDEDVEPGKQEVLRKLVVDGMDEATIRSELFGGTGSPRRNLFFGYLVRFGQRDPSRDELPPSLLSCVRELSIIGKLQETAKTVRFLSSVLPAIGLLGTLSGMFMAFHGTDFQKGAALAETMGDLMENFALALWTTITAVILKIAVDLFCHFTVETHLSSLKGELSRLRLLLLDILAEKTPSTKPAEAAEQANAAPAQRPDTTPAHTTTGPPTDSDRNDATD